MKEKIKSAGYFMLGITAISLVALVSLKIIIEIVKLLI